MRSLLVAYSVLALFLTTSACGEDPDDVPRTVPPTSVPSMGAAPPANEPEAVPVKGSGPILDA
jgi:hypothetical protein